MGKHAFLVIAYDDGNHLKELLSAIDSLRSDIYIHIDKKSKLDISDMKIVCKKSDVYFIDRIGVIWGSEYLIEAELKLLKASTDKQQYDYYHMISGHDFPLVNENEFYPFFDDHQGLEFIDCRDEDLESILLRVKYYYPFQSISNGKSMLNRVLNKVMKLSQQLIGIDRISSSEMKYGFGSNWFSITDSFARYVVSQEEFIKKYFYKGICADEMFLQTIWLNSPMYDRNRQYQNFEYKSCLEPKCRNAVRAIDFTQGDGRSPRIFDETDYELLINSGCIFGRKLDSRTSKKLIEMLLS